MDVNEKEKTEDVKRIENLIKNIRPMKEYASVFKEHCTERKERISTGYLELDRRLNGGLTNELYIMGAETSTGKSAFLMSIAQNVAERGIDVLYFALEMGRDEFVARAISMISYEMNKRDSKENFPVVTAGDVLYWTYDNDLKEFAKVSYRKYEAYAEEYFRRYGEHLHIIESGLSGFRVRDIANIASVYKKQHPDNQVVIFVDYMQIIKADPKDRTQTDRKTKTDVVTTTLKTLASQIGMPVITISSISRSNYNGKIGTSAFKESGDTEYTGGVLIGWNWDGVTNEGDEEKRAEEKEKCKERGYRRMSLEVLKYRNSERDTGVWFNYYPAYNYFEKADGEEKKERSTKGARDKRDRPNIVSDLHFK